MQIIFEPAHEIVVLFVLSKLIFQTGMLSHPMGLDVWFLVGAFVYFHTACLRTTNSEGCGETARMCRLAWAFAGRICDKYHELTHFKLDINVKVPRSKKPQSHTKINNIEPPYARLISIYLQIWGDGDVEYFRKVCEYDTHYYLVIWWYL